MGSIGSGRRSKQAIADDEVVGLKREAVRIAARATPQMMDLLIDKARQGNLNAITAVLDRGLGKPVSQVDVNVSGTVLHLTPEDVLRQRELLAAQDTLLLGDGT